MKLGRLDLCINAKNFQSTYSFYTKLGFKFEEGDLQEGWCVLSHSNLRLGLFTNVFDGIMLNFRGGNVKRITEELKLKGVIFKQDFKPGKDGGGSASIPDPDDYQVFFDTAPSELELLNKKFTSSTVFSVRDDKIIYGRCDICLKVANLQNSYEFYSALGFKLVEGSIEEEWLVLEVSNLRLVLSKGETHDLIIKFRGSDIEEIFNLLTAEGFKFSSPFTLEVDGSQGASLSDPEGNLIYFNTHSITTQSTEENQI